MIDHSSGRRRGSSGMGSWARTRSSQVGYGVGGARGQATHGSPSGSPRRTSSQLSSLPTKSSRLSLCSRMSRTVGALSVGNSATETWPAIQMARSLITKWAQFFEMMAMWLRGGRSSARRYAAMRLASSSVRPRV